MFYERHVTKLIHVVAEEIIKMIRCFTREIIKKLLYPTKIINHQYFHVHFRLDSFRLHLRNVNLNHIIV